MNEIGFVLILSLLRLFNIISLDSFDFLGIFRGVKHGYLLFVIIVRFKSMAERPSSTQHKTLGKNDALAVLVKLPSNFTHQLVTIPLVMEVLLSQNQLSILKNACRCKLTSTSVIYH